MSRAIRRFLLGLTSLIVLLGVLLASIGILTVRRSFPTVKGDFQVAGLDGPADIYRDRHGVPHIFAATQHDLFFAQGYVHAQDRFWQMDFWRHIGSGRVSEMFGTQDTIETDQFLRTLGWARVAQQELAATGPESMSILQAYADGVNAYLADHQGSALSLEYAILKLNNSDYRPEPWQPLHTLTWAKVMAWDLGGNMDVEISNAALLKGLTPQQLSELFPEYPADSPVIVTQPQEAEESGRVPSRPASELSQAATTALQQVSRSSAALQALLGPNGTGTGSNSWVISGSLTATGKPFLANDPHLGVQMPSIWYQIGLHCAPRGPQCPYEVSGFSFAGSPGVVIGHNDRIAWGLTNVGPDVQDLYIEKINPDNPNQYEVNGQWVDMTLVEETIQPAGGDPISLTVRYTRHGPIISDTYGSLEGFEAEAGVALPARYAIALRWTALEPLSVINYVLMLNKARNWDEFREAAAYLDAPAQNMVYADVDGNIGYQMPGNIPIRNQGDGSLPVPGWTDEYEWTGYIPFEELPSAFNPPEGYIVTANNRVIGPEYPYLITTLWDYGYRAQRIVEMIEQAPGPIEAGFIQKMQGDNRNLNAERLVPVLLQIPVEDERLERARSLLQGWDYQNHMDSAAAALFESFWKNLLADTFQDDLPEGDAPDGGARWYLAVHQLVDQPGSQWWDNRQTPEIETRDQVFLQAFQEAVNELEARLGKDPQDWAWGELHTVTFRNASLGESGIAPIEALFNRGPFRASGGQAIVNATSWKADVSYQVRSLPSMRMIVDLADLNNSLSVHTTGQSGHAYHPHYADFVDLWANIQYYPMYWEREQIEANAEGRLRLSP